MNWDLSLKIAQVLSPFFTSIAVTVMGVVIVRRIEGIRAEVTKRSAFEARWADEFFDACQQFERALERKATILVSLCFPENRSEEDHTKLKRELPEAHDQAMELLLRIRRCAEFAPMSRDRISQLAEDSLDSITEENNLGRGFIVPFLRKLTEFNICARAGHAEILALGLAQPTKGPTS